MPPDNSDLDRQIESLERSLRLLERRIDRLEAGQAIAAPAPPTALPATAPPSPTAQLPPPPRPVPTVARPARTRERQVDLEQLLGGRLLAWVGGIAVVLGIVFFVTMAIHRGWIGEGMRVLLAFATSTSLMGAGVWLHERQGRTQAAKTLVAAAIAAQFASLTAATAIYELVSPLAGFFIAGVVGAAASAIAIRWQSPQIAGIGILGSLLAPVLVDADPSLLAVAFMALALTSSVAVVLWERWPWLATLAYVVSLPQLWAWMDDTRDDHLYRALAVLIGFWILYLIAAIGYDLRVSAKRLRAPSAMLAFSNVVITTGIGYRLLESEVSGDAGTAWVLLMAALHVAIGFVMAWRGTSARELALLAAAMGIGLSAIGFALALDGPVLVSGWAVEAVLLAWLARRTESRRALAGAFALLALAGGRALEYELTRIDSHGTGSEADAAAIVALLVVAASAALIGRLLPRHLTGKGVLGLGEQLSADELRRMTTPVLDALALAFLAVALDVAISSWLLPIAWVALALALVPVWKKLGSPAYPAASVGLLALASIHVLAFEVPPSSALGEGLDRAGVEFVSLLCLALGWAVTARYLRFADSGAEKQVTLRALTMGIPALASLYLGSALIVTLAPSGETGGTEIGQMLLSVFWAVCGLAALVTGLLRSSGWMRGGGFCLLLLASGKVFLYDLASLDQMARVLSLIGLGLLLLAATFLYQRLATAAGGERGGGK